MKFTNIKQLLINFKGGGLINFPFKHLKEVDIDGDTDEQSGGGSSTPLTKLNTIKNYVNILYDHYNVEFDVVEETSSYEEEVEDENGDLTGEVITVTTKKYKFVPKTNIPRVYLNGNNGSGTITPSGIDLIINSANTLASANQNGISDIRLNGTALTVLQLLDYDIVQVGVAKFPINAPNYHFDDHEGYVEYLDWVRNNVTETVEVPILLIGEERSENTRNYESVGFINSKLFLNTDKGFYSQTVLEVLIPEE